MHSLREVYRKMPNLSPGNDRQKNNHRRGFKRKHRRNITRRVDKVFDLLKNWRLEASVIDRIEENIRGQILWFDEMIKLFNTLPYRVESTFDGEGVSLTCRFDELADP